MKMKLLFTVPLFLPWMCTNAFALSLTLVNRTEWEIHHLFLSPAHAAQWGPDQLRDEVIRKGGSFQLREIERGRYDLKIVDEDGDECVVPAVDFDTSEEVVLTDPLLVGCQKATEIGKEALKRTEGK